ncbi:MAG TPA: adenylate/guanylate cyclase domain-containing protein [Bacillales bacterium]|nr:adenylate/guanylate cyclase domain-containing protein [Bacillales bacterium]
MIKISQNDENKLSNKINKNEQRQTIINLFDSGIPLEIIALQLDIELDEVNKVIQNISDRTDIEKKYLQNNPNNRPMSVFYLDAVVDIPKIISSAQSSMWKALRTDPVFTFPFNETQEILSHYSVTKINSMILHIDIVGSTKLSMTLPIERISKIIQAFTQEMTKIIRLYGGYVLKYIGDAIIGFFMVGTDNLYLPCINAINCAKTMIKVINQGFNPVLSQYDYPDMGVRIGIDYGENVVVKYLNDSDNTGPFDDGLAKQKPPKNEIDTKQPIYDILGYTISIATKMTAYAKVDHIIVGQLIYDILSKEEQSYFTLIDTSPENWNYISDETGTIYKLYINRT